MSSFAPPSPLACPACSKPLVRRPKRKTACPYCGVLILVRGGQLTTEDIIWAERTADRSKQTERILRESAEWDNDLVQVSSSSNPCSICAPFNGKIFSIHGKTPGYPILKEVPPFCNRCTHSLSPISIEAINWKPHKSE